MADHRRVDSGWLTELVAEVFEAAGVGRGAALRLAEGLVEADARGTSSHGTLLVPMYVERLRRGSISTAEGAELVVDLGAVAVLDADHCLGQLSADQAMSLAVAKAQQFGVGVVSVRRAAHFGGAYRYVQQAAAAGCIGIAAANTRPLMPAPGGAAAVVGNNPLAIGVPAASGEPVVLDMALSATSLGRIRLAEQEGQAIPPTWATDRDGRPTTSAAEAVAGLLQPAAGHKGFGLALMVDVLTGILSGGGFGAAVKGLYADLSVPNDCAHFFLALDVRAFGAPEQFAERLAELSRQVLDSPTAPGTERTLLPGQLEAERAAVSATQGIELPAAVYDALLDTAQALGVIREAS
ncbi:Ldh family oxidoreductase [Kribbella sandramycini]|uniref:LDH2 family malate/lactate/ureidoglycolate dehydrogenase n=1 Tax=Kribbella sandramycini TaxID=60450 RepID=A0A7Y4KW20_9ACTN|nr:LDH2 family malate/lactate/ureidoglycolate dehydrogenase [Kribbella sandramycini]NOL39639.1 Ldh family oxidoreductase [Kribbella sandramycini]